MATFVNTLLYAAQTAYFIEIRDISLKKEDNSSKNDFFADFWVD
ncbi:MAG: hypothetical protein WBD27_09890 [Pyrinomonadaceae bacterium]|jgi:hypothetical protein